MDDRNGQMTIDPGCCGQVPDIGDQIKKACDRAAESIISPHDRPYLKECIKDRCNNARVSCDGFSCWFRNNLPGNDGDTIGHADPEEDPYGITLCLNYGDEATRGKNWGCVAVHEAAHLCGWQHGDGAEVPGNSGFLDTGECDSFLGR
jgi:hypothetical protein